ncbi:interference hedgehog-like [Neocloeon triangulifer]|uniref:interference hedgehog-like n=1 Tax=Neocloeon triangulifer TaxID=2078957 RepID=UPI00286EDDB3|nr:interference hedgehog-like [Neocloeon triangulifer]XP_059474787.1 interference hedgehog-like [Neocloeon triangulifer]XP_059474796.1 interference hedgehog-like [Neocloeon triangulifer]XP_059474803.1 interference hedgehog-like [Neocloeon triangulifer]XP_059474811.1 interference hedgehog-like [Neocloeon triangulifer]XP_059474819.1 interference hedgehog-like [Neocloeon triangulifer]
MGQDCRSVLFFSTCFLLVWAANILADVPGLRFARHPVSTVAVPGAEVVLECALNVSADRVLWQLNGQPLSPIANRASGRLVVRLAKEKEDYELQTGIYQCVAWFGASAMASLPAEVAVAHMEEPSGSSLTSTVRTSSGNVVFLSCPPPKSTPPAQVTFRRDGHQLSAHVSEQGGLLLANVTPADSGRYSCSATNTVAGQTVALPMNFQLQVEAAPRQKVAPHFPLSAPSNYSVLAGKDVTLECPASGWPPPSFTWSKYGGSLPAERTAMISAALLLSKVSRADEGTYVCEAKNSFGAPVKCIISLHVMEPPVVVKEPMSKMVEEGGEVQLECSARGWPTPEIKWLLNGNSVDRDPHITTAGGRLSIRLVEKRHAGIIQCFASSSMGSAFGLAMLQVQPKTINSRPNNEEFFDQDEFEEQGSSKGEKNNRRRNKDKKERKQKGHAVMIPPSFPNITRLSDESVMVRWDVQSDKGLPIQFFKVQYKDMDKGRWNTIDEDIPSHIRSYEVDNLKPDHYYKFRISAVYSNNDNMQGHNSARFHLQKEPTTKKPLYAPTITYGEAASTSAITIKWEYTSVPSVPVEGFFIYYRSSTMAGDYTKATVMGANTREFLITHLLPDSSYDIKVQAFNSAGTSGFSEVRYYRTLYVLTSEEPSSTESIPGGGGLGVGLGNKGETLSLGLILGIIFGGLLLLIVLLCLGVYFCKHSNSRTSASEHDTDKEAQAYGLVTVGKPITNGTTHHVHQIRHTHRHQQRVHITSNPLASTTEHFKVESVVEVASQNNNCSDPARRRLRTNSLDDEEDDGVSVSEGAGGSSEEEAPPVPPRQLDSNYV